MKKRVVCAMLAAMMVFSTATPMRAAVEGSSTGGSVSAEAKLESPIYKVSVSTALDLYIDPFQLLDNGGDVTSSDFSIINKSNAPIEVKAAISLKGADDVTLVDSASGVNEDDTSKLALVQVQVPSAVTEVTDTTANKYVGTSDWSTEIQNLYTGTPESESTAIKYVGQVNDTSIVTSESAVADGMKDTTKATGTYTTKKEYDLDPTGDTVLSFALNKATYIDYYSSFENYKNGGEALHAFEGVAANQEGSAVFRFGGKVNTKANWKNSDISAKVTYSFLALTDGNYTTATNASNMDASTKGHRITGTPTVIKAATFTAGTNVGEITYVDGDEDRKISKILSATLELDGVTYDGLNALDDCWEPATQTTGNITLQSECVEFWKDLKKVDVTITYETVGGETVTTVVKNVLTSK